MKISAIIAEYNPFHTGHAHHIAATRAAGADFVIVILSGSFVQRGEPALLDKWSRTRMALGGGADLVLELPTGGVLSSAEGFARAAVSVLEGIGCVDTLSFGAETADIPLLSSIAHFLCHPTPAYSAALAAHLGAGHSFPRAQSMALEASLGADAAYAASLPNNTLALEYLKALSHLNSSITPLAVPRKSAYLSMVPRGQFASALAIRSSIAAGRNDWQPFVAPADLPLFARPVAEDALFTPLLYCLRSMDAGQISHIADVAEGLEHRIVSAARSAGTYGALLESIKTKRFPMARIKRILLHCLLGITAADMAALQAAPPYARVLGVRQGSKHLLSVLAAASRIPVYTTPPKEGLPLGLALDIRASDLHALAYTPARSAGADYTTPLLIV